MIKRFLILSICLIIIIFTINITEKALYPIKYQEYVYKYSIENNIDPCIVFAVIKAESGFDTNATSSKDARGLMQIGPKTGKWGADKLKINNFNPENLYNPEINIKIGSWYLANLMKEFNNNIDLVLAAYNGGSGNVTEWLRDKNLNYSGDNPDKIPFGQTKRFVKKVKNYYMVYKDLYE